MTFLHMLTLDSPQQSGRNKSISSQQSDRLYRSPNLSQHGFEPLGPPADRSNRKMQSSENFHSDRNAHHADSTNGRSARADLEGQSYHKSTEDQRRDAAQAGLVPGDDDKWIHRDKLAKIESEELQAAGFFVPRSRAPSKQRRERSQVSYRRGTDTSEQGNSRSRKNSAAVEHKPSSDPNTPAWDLRTPEEIAEEEANAYFATNNTQKGGSRIPVAKSSLAPISNDHLERAQPVMRNKNESSDGESLYYSKTRSRSASATGKDAAAAATAAASGKRSVTDSSSPKKNATGSRKTSAVSKPPTTASTQPGRPKTRSGSGSTRPSTRSGEKQPEGDPPWMANAYKPDPRLPPDQQLLPTVARRLQQEQWEKEGKFGDAYDKEFRPINDNVYLRPPEAEPAPADEELRSQETSSEWPLKPEATAKSPTLRQGSYSTMPKISDKPPGSPIPSPRTPMTPQPPMHTEPQSAQVQPFQRIEQEEPEPKKGGCGCCVVM